MVLVSLLRLRREAPEATHQNLSKNSCCRNQTATPQNRSKDTRERRGEGGRERTITRKRLLMHGQTGQQTKHAPWAPRKSPKKLQIRSSTDQQPATNCGVRQGIRSERTTRLHGANGPNQTHWPVSARAPQWRSHGAAAAGGAGEGEGTDASGERRGDDPGGLLLYEATARGIWQEIIAGAMGMEGLVD